MKAYRRKFFYLESHAKVMEPMTIDRIRQNGFDVKVAREHLPYFISFSREWRSFFKDKAKEVHPLYRPYMEETAEFFDEQVEQMTLCTAPHNNSKAYFVPFTDLVAAFMQAFDAFDQVLDAYHHMPAHFETALKYYRRFTIQADPAKAQFILNHLPDLRLSVE